MALRVSVTAAPDITIIGVNGRLAGDGAAELERECRAARRPIVLDLTHLTGLDDSGCRLLHLLTGEGLHVVGASPYVAMLLAIPEPAGPGVSAGPLPYRRPPGEPTGRRPSGSASPARGASRRARGRR
jgi:hypothetical protein